MGVPHLKKKKKKKKRTYKFRGKNRKLTNEYYSYIKYRLIYPGKGCTYVIFSHTLQGERDLQCVTGCYTE